jgi:hypothetical protein
MKKRDEELSHVRKKKMKRREKKFIYKLCFLVRISKIKLNFEFSDRFKSKRLGKAVFFKYFFTRRTSILFIITTHPVKY